MVAVKHDSTASFECAEFQSVRPIDQFDTDSAYLGSTGCCWENPNNESSLKVNIYFCEAPLPPPKKKISLSEMQGNPEELGKSACYLYFQLFMMIFENLVCT